MLLGMRTMNCDVQCNGLADACAGSACACRPLCLFRAPGAFLHAETCCFDLRRECLSVIHLTPEIAQPAVSRDTRPRYSGARPKPKKKIRRPVWFRVGLLITSSLGCPAEMPASSNQNGLLGSTILQPGKQSSTGWFKLQYVVIDYSRAPSMKHLLAGYRAETARCRGSTSQSSTCYDFA